eukprot:Clim_evm80s25 gene=Clim_evmTU80s25
MTAGPMEGGLSSSWVQQWMTTWTAGPEDPVVLHEALKKLYTKGRERNRKYDLATLSLPANVSQGIADKLDALVQMNGCSRACVQCINMGLRVDPSSVVGKLPAALFKEICQCSWRMAQDESGDSGPAAQLLSHCIINRGEDVEPEIIDYFLGDEQDEWQMEAFSAAVKTGNATQINLLTIASSILSSKGILAAKGKLTLNQASLAALVPAVSLLRSLKQSLELQPNEQETEWVLKVASKFLKFLGSLATNLRAEDFRSGSGTKKANANPTVLEACGDLLMDLRTLALYRLPYRGEMWELSSTNCASTSAVASNRNLRLQSDMSAGEASGDSDSGGGKKYSVFFSGADGRPGQDTDESPSWVRRYALQRLAQFFMILPPRIVHANWGKFVPEGAHIGTIAVAEQGADADTHWREESQAREVPKTLADIAVLDPSLRNRAACFAALTALFSSSGIKQFLSIAASDPNAMTSPHARSSSASGGKSSSSATSMTQVQSGRNFSASGYTSLSERLGISIEVTHRVLWSSLNREQSAVVLLSLLQCLAAVLRSSVYARLRDGFLNTTLDAIVPYLQARTADVRVASHSTLAALLSADGERKTALLSTASSNSAANRELWSSEVAVMLLERGVITSLRSRVLGEKGEVTPVRIEACHCLVVAITNQFEEAYGSIDNGGEHAAVDAAITVALEVTEIAKGSCGEDLALHTLKVVEAVSELIQKHVAALSVQASEHFANQMIDNCIPAALQTIKGPVTKAAICDVIYATSRISKSYRHQLREVVMEELYRLTGDRKQTGNSPILLLAIVRALGGMIDREAFAETDQSGDKRGRRALDFVLSLSNTKATGVGSTNGRDAKSASTLHTRVFWSLSSVASQIVDPESKTPASGELKDATESLLSFFIDAITVADQKKLHANACAHGMRGIGILATYGDKKPGSSSMARSIDLICDCLWHVEVTTGDDHGNSRSSSKPKPQYHPKVAWNAASAAARLLDGIENWNVAYDVAETNPLLHRLWGAVLHAALKAANFKVRTSSTAVILQIQEPAERYLGNNPDLLYTLLLNMLHSMDLVSRFASLSNMQHRDTLINKVQMTIVHLVSFVPATTALPGGQKNLADYRTLLQEHASVLLRVFSSLPRPSPSAGSMPQLRSDSAVGGVNDHKGGNDDGFTRTLKERNYQRTLMFLLEQAPQMGEDSAVQSLVELLQAIR